MSTTTSTSDALYLVEYIDGEPQITKQYATEEEAKEWLPIAKKNEPDKTWQITKQTITVTREPVEV
jgi:hypothetical protein